MDKTSLDNNKNVQLLNLPKVVYYNCRFQLYKYINKVYN